MAMPEKTTNPAVLATELSLESPSPAAEPGSAIDGGFRVQSIEREEEGRRALEFVGWGYFQGRGKFTGQKAPTLVFFFLTSDRKRKPFRQTRNY